MKSKIPFFSLRNYALIFLLFSFLGCTESEENTIELLSSIKETAKLSTTKITLSKIVVGYKENSGFFVNLNLKKPISWDNTVIVHTEATLEAGISLDHLTRDSILVDGESITLNMPAVEIFYLDYPPDKFKMDENYSKGLGNGWPTPMDLDQIFQKAEISIRESVNYLGIREETEIRTRFFLESLLKRMGYRDININFARKDPLMVSPFPQENLKPEETSDSDKKSGKLFNR